MIARGLRLVSLAGLCALTFVLVAGVGSAGAVMSQFGSAREGAGQFAGQTVGAAVDQDSRDVYVVDSNNNRVEKFGPEGEFLLGWGWGVADGVTNTFQTCETVCFRGIPGFGSGQFAEARNVAVDNSPNPLDFSHGDVYVADRADGRVEKFTSTGEFLLMFGGEVNETKDSKVGATEAEKDVCTAESGDVCKTGVAGSNPGELSGESVLAVGATGTVYVG